MFAPNVRPAIKKVLPSMLDFIASLGDKNGQSWQGWQIHRIDGGWNNLLYRATSEQADLAVKFSVVDERDRAGREFHALEALAQNGLDIAPEPICLARERYPQPVMVQSWLQGGVSGNPPTTDEEWEAWLQNLVLTHTVTPETTTVPIHPAVLTAYNADEATHMIWSHLARLPLEERPGKLQSLVRMCTETDYPVWHAPSPSLCHVDSNIRNFIRRPLNWAGVDWENSGWGDPAYEIADLTMHAAHIGIPEWRQEWAIDRYCELAAQPDAGVRIRTYRKTLAVWWAVRISRYLYELPLGLDPRLASISEGRMDGLEKKYHHYMALAESLYL